MPSLGPLEIVVIAVVALLVFGPNRLPEVGRQVGRAVRELRKFQDTVRDELHGVMNTMDTQPTTVANDADARPGTPPTLPPVVAAPRPTPPPRPGGAQAPSRFRPSASPAAPAATPTPTPSSTPPAASPAATPGPGPGPTPAPKPAAGAHAPSRFRSPNR